MSDYYKTWEVGGGESVECTEYPREKVRKACPLLLVGRNQYTPECLEYACEWYIDGACITEHIYNLSKTMAKISANI